MERRSEEEEKRKKGERREKRVEGDQRASRQIHTEVQNKHRRELFTFCRSRKVDILF